MADTGTPPVIPDEFQQYNSYVEDPKWQVRFSIIWASAVGLAIVLSLPHLVRSIRSGRAFVGLFGVREQWGAGYEAVRGEEEQANVRETKGMPSVIRRSRGSRMARGVLGSIGSVLVWSPPGIELNVGQIFVVTAYLIVVVVCITVKAPLISNPNRAGFMALAQFPVVFLFATKNSVLSLLLGPGNGYEKLNYIHRWSGRAMFLGGVIHGALWVRNHLEWDLPILGQQKETSGVASLGLLCVIVLSSLRWVRRWAYELFLIIHTLSFIAFYVTICYHTIYAPPWIFAPLALYGLDILMRMFRHRIKDATLLAVDKQMTLIKIPHATSGWLPGQHIRLRVFFGGRIFEAHPLTIVTAPPGITCMSEQVLGLGMSDGDAPGIVLGARVRGDWTRALNAYAQGEGERTRRDIGGLEGAAAGDEKRRQVEVPIQVMIDGPYGGCGIDLGRYETVLLFAGGSGATFSLGMLDDLVGRCVKAAREGTGEMKTRRVQFAWCVRSFGSIEWFAPYLMAIAHAAARLPTLDLYISIYVTCLCNPEAVPPIPNCDVTIVRPSVGMLLRGLVTPPPLSSKPGPEQEPRASMASSQAEEGGAGTEEDAGKGKGLDADADVDVEADLALNIHEKLQWVGRGGGVGVCASGPESMTREAGNAVARLRLGGWGLGEVGLHTELFSS